MTDAEEEDVRVAAGELDGVRVGAEEAVVVSKATLG